MSLGASSPEQFEFPVNLENSKCKINKSEFILGKLSQMVGQLKTTLNRELSLQFMLVKQEFLSKLCSAISELSRLSMNIVEEQLPDYEYQQKLARNGENISLHDKFSILLNNCEEVATLVVRCRKQLEEINTLTSTVLGGKSGQNENAEILENINQLIAYLITSTIVVKEQPPQLLKLQTYFTATLTSLVGHIFNESFTLPHVEVGIVSQEFARLWGPSDQLRNFGVMQNNTGTMSYDTNGYLNIAFEKLKLRSIQRPDIRLLDRMPTEQLYYFYFQFRFSGVEKKVIFSLPIVAIMNGSQAPRANATIIWENAFRERERFTSNLSDRISWSNLAHILNTKFRSMVGFDLDNDQLAFLGEKLFRHSDFQSDDMLNWSQFARDRLPDCSFTSWDWFYACMVTSKRHLRNLWKNSLVHGFITRANAEEKLRSTGVAGTFLLRFSNRKIGEIVIDCLHSNGDVISVGPFSSYTLQLVGLANIVMDLPYLTTLYPYMDKVATFSPHTRSTAVAQNEVIYPYVEARLAVQANIPLANH